MVRFRLLPAASTEPITPAAVRRLAADLLAPAHFFLGPGMQLESCHHPAEEISWELFQGRLLDPAHTRRRQTFEAWSVYQKVGDGLSGEPILSLKLDAPGERLFVVRGLECHVQEGYDSGGGVILTREQRKWVRELTGTIELSRFADLDHLQDELICLLFHAVVGTSRLPLHSVEAPLPAFSFGDMFYCHRAGAETRKEVRDWRALRRDSWSTELNELERVKLLETVLHAVSAAELPDAAAAFRDTRHVLRLLRTLFNEVSLSPWTDLVEKVLGFLDALEVRAERPLATAEIVDFLSHLLRQTCRHLTAYDLVSFHYRGANYPDALLLDAVLKAYLGHITRCPELFVPYPQENEASARVKRRRRRALRQSWLVRRQYEGHPVPDLPTSPGENNRVLPASHPRVPEEQIVTSSRRTRRLYAGDPLPDQPGGAIGEALRQSVRELHHADELRELGLGLFIERPFGAGKAPAQPDHTLLLASIGFSRSLAAQRLSSLHDLGLLACEPADEISRRLEREPVAGLPLDVIGPARHPGAMGLSLARQAAADFVFLRTMLGGVAEFLQQFDVTPLARDGDLSWLTGDGPVLFARSPSGPGVRVYDRELRPRLELEADLGGGFVSLAGREVPANGLQGRWLTAGTGETHGRIVQLPPR